MTGQDRNLTPKKSHKPTLKSKLSHIITLMKRIYEYLVDNDDVITVSPMTSRL